MYAIETMGLTKRYGNVTAVDNLSLQIKEGELFALLGVNGAGKTTTLRMLTCLTLPTSGDASVSGYSVVKSAWEVKRRIAVSPQDTAIAPNLTIRENLELLCDIYGFSKGVKERKIEEMAERFHFEGLLSKKAGTLSGGWQRRLSVSMGLISEPAVLFLDEPTLGLDVLARSELWECIRALKGRVTVVLTTHYMEEAEALSDRIGIMQAGRLLTVGTAGALMERAGVNRFEDAFIAVVKGECV